MRFGGAAVFDDSAAFKNAGQPLKIGAERARPGAAGARAAEKFFFHETVYRDFPDFTGFYTFAWHFTFEM